MWTRVACGYRGQKSDFFVDVINGWPLIKAWKCIKTPKSIGKPLKLSSQNIALAASLYISLNYVTLHKANNNNNNNNFRVSNIRVSNRTLIYNVCPEAALT